MFPAIFLDRDGVIIENRADYVKSWAEVELFEQAINALQRAAGLPYRFVMVTNQSAVGRGIISLAAAQEINQRLVEIIRQAGGRIDGVYLCPHAPQDGCRCRKPRPGMLVTAAKEMNLDLSRSIMVGDAITDLQAGEAAGVERLYLVQTGRGSRQEALLPPQSFPSLTVCKSLAAVLDHLSSPVSPDPFD